MTSTSIGISAAGGTARRWYDVRRWDPVLTLCFAWIIILVGWAVLGLPLPHDPLRADLGNSVAPPSAANWLGTDQVGFDVFSRSVKAASNDVVLAMVGVGISAILGTVFGVLLSRPGRVSELAMRALDLVQAIPLLVVAITLVGLVGGSRVMLVAVVVMVNAPLFIRLVRSEALILRRRGFVEISRSLGASEWYVAIRHIAPNCSGVIFPQLSLSLGYGIMAISAIGFLGFIPPGTASWGAMLNGGVPLLLSGAWWISIFPSIFIFLTVLAFSEASNRLQRLIERPLDRAE
jgi:ABC-type dipeptide/oligopeptide/nickel transport systems, permease components